MNPVLQFVIRLNKMIMNFNLMMKSASSKEKTNKLRKSLFETFYLNFLSRRGERLGKYHLEMKLFRFTFHLSKK